LDIDIGDYSKVDYFVMSKIPVIKGHRNSPNLVESQLNVIMERISMLKKKRPRALTEEQRLDILMLYHRLQANDLEEQRKQPELKKAKGNYQERVSSLLGYGKQTVSDTYRDWRNSCQVLSALPPANRTRKRERIPKTSEVICAIRELILERRVQKKQVLARHVWDLMCQRKWLIVDESDRKACASSQRAVRRYLERRGFCGRGGSTGTPLKETQSIIIARTRYLQRLIENANLPPEQQLRLVDVDESCIYLRPKKVDVCFNESKDAKPVRSRMKYDGERISFVMAIQSAKPNSNNNALSITGDCAGVVPNSLWIFESGQIQEDFNSLNFSDWFKTKLLPNLHQPSLIRLDNASYHTALPTNIANITKLKKEEVRSVLIEAGIECKPFDTFSTLRLKLKEYLSKIEPEIVELAKAQGHEVLFTPPFHYDLRPMEMLWSRVKGEICRSNNVDTDVDVVLQKLRTVFENLESDPSPVQMFYDRVAKTEDLYCQADAEEDEYEGEFLANESGEDNDEEPEELEDRSLSIASNSDEDHWFETPFEESNNVPIDSLPDDE